MWKQSRTARCKRPTTPYSKDDKKIKLSIAYNPLAILHGPQGTMTMAEVRRDFTKVMIKEGADYKKGAGPPPEVERQVQRLLKKRQGGKQ